MYTVIAHYRAALGNEGLVAALLASYVPLVRNEPGNQSFHVGRGHEDVRDFVLFEVYTSKEMFDAHVASGHYRDIITEAVRPLLESRAVSFYDAIEPVVHHV